ncbi:hypothetical protein QR680_008840 [Steinernema hermaphroditum]|uniref:Uncharacterized protein n=1 Tax=Steinernema hermaphroditum TaxID=289476 RepID=A0AA39IKA4_9BILA|nr:hypothetical protein QR680_008840 [Steinernema hermaphroditum]
MSRARSADSSSLANISPPPTLSRRLCMLAVAALLKRISAAPRGDLRATESDYTKTECRASSRDVAVKSHAPPPAPPPPAIYPSDETTFLGETEILGRPLEVQGERRSLFEKLNRTENTGTMFNL